MLVGELVTELTGSESWLTRSSPDDDGVVASADDDGTATPLSPALHDKPTKATTAAATPEIERLARLPTMRRR
jgi:hypothetical protein